MEKRIIKTVDKQFSLTNRSASFVTQCMSVWVRNKRIESMCCQNVTDRLKRDGQQSREEN